MIDIQFTLRHAVGGIVESENQLFSFLSLVGRGEQAIATRTTALASRAHPAACSFSPRAARSCCLGNTQFFRRFGGRVAKAFALAAAILLNLHASGAELIRNGGVEAGSAPWGLQGASVTSAGGYAHSGGAYLQIIPDYNQAYGYQANSIPANVTAATLTFYWSVDQFLRAWRR